MARDSLPERYTDTGQGTSAAHRRARTDLGNAERLVARFGGRLRYIHSWKQWLTWNGRRWTVDETGEAIRCAKQTAKQIYSEVPQAADEEEEQEILRWARTSQGRGRIEAMLTLAQSERPVPITHRTLNTDPWLLNCENGTVDLKSGVLRPHCPRDLITKSTGVEYPNDAGVDAVLWTEFLAQIFAADSELIHFLQRLMGAALVGQQIEHLLPVFYGTGANGKSVFTRTVQAALGDYAMTAPQGLLTAKPHEQHPTELADLFGARLVILSETKDGQRLNEGLVKSITGGDQIRARRMREDFWEFAPSHLPILVTNHKPVVRGNDHGIWRRLKLVPFEVTIPAAEQDPHLADKLHAERPAILRWMVAGCLAWQKDGLQEPQSVRTATADYQSESDVLQQWIDDDCIVATHTSARSSDLFARYQKWCQTHGEKPLNHRQFGQRLGQRFAPKRKAGGVFYNGLGLTVEEPKQCTF